MTPWPGWPATFSAGCLALALALLRGPPPRPRLHLLLASSGDPRPAVGSATASAAVRLLRRRPDAGVRVLAELWAADLRSGKGVDQALLNALEAHPTGARACRRTATAAELHGDVAAALRLDAEQMSPRDRAAARALAACWVVGREGGTGLADAVERVADSVRAEEEHRARVRTELAGARSSARLLAVLPLLVLVMSTGLGLTSFAEVAGSRWAVLSVLVGVLLAGVGLWWTEQIARSAERVG